MKYKNSIIRRKVEFIHLRNRTSYSLSEGSIKVKDLASLAKESNMPAIGITDNNNLFASLEFSNDCVSAGIQPIIGVLINLLIDEKFFDLILYAKDKKGYQNLIQLVSKSYLENMKNGKNNITIENLIEYNEGLIILTGGIKGYLGQMLLANNVKLAEEFIDRLKEIFGDRLYIELTRIGYIEEQKIEDQMLNMAYQKNIPIVATNEVFYTKPENYSAQDVLICISNNNYIDDENRQKLLVNHYFKSQEEMKHLFADLPEALENTINIARRCYVMSEMNSPMLPSFSSILGRDENEEITRQSLASLEKKLVKILEKILDDDDRQIIRDKYINRLNFELEIITKMNFSGYFLIVSDFVKWSKENNIPVGPGRGSGPGSIVAWCLEITDLDPIEFGLLFERFLNPARISMPDFDIDFCQERREEVINYVSNKYGKERVAQIITFGKLQPKAVLRDVGRVLQLPYSQVDKISKMIPFSAVNPLSLSEAIEVEPELKRLIKNDEEIADLVSIALKLEGLNRHASTHAAGIIICSKNLSEVVPLYKDEKSDLTIVQYSMKYAEMSGLVKFDFLGLKTLTVIAKTLEYIANRNIKISLEDISYKDKKTFELLSRGESAGIFQFESPGMKDALRKLQPDQLNDIIALGALYRPGPMDNIPAYIACKHGIEQPDYLHPKLKNLLKETFGVIIYQEQVMEIAKILAGYSLGEADILRKAMGKKIKEEMDQQREIFIMGAAKNDLSENRASEIFDLVAKFAGYGFNKAHATSYGIISYHTAYLKANYITEFLTATLNLDIDDTDKIGLFCHEAKKYNIIILSPSINNSDAYFKIKQGNENNSIYYGLGALKGVGVAATAEMIQERNLKGKFCDIEDFVKRCSNKIINKRQLESLIKAGAFDEFEPNRKKLFDSTEKIIKFHNLFLKEENDSQINLFSLNNKINFKLELIDSDEEWSKTEKLNNELEVMGFYLNTHPISDIKEFLVKENICYSNELEIRNEGLFKVRMVGVVINTKTRMSPRGRFISVQLSDPEGLFDVSIFDDELLSRTRDFLDNKDPLLIEAECRKTEGGIRLSAINIKLLDDILKGQKRKISIYCNDNINLDNLSSLLISTSNSGFTVKLIIISDNQEIIIGLSGNFDITPNILAKLKIVKYITKLDLS